MMLRLYEIVPRSAEETVLAAIDNELADLVEDRVTEEVQYYVQFRVEIPLEDRTTSTARSIRNRIR